MPTFIQLRDGIGYAVVRSHGEVDHSVTPDHTTAIQVEDENPDQFLRKKYDETSKTWSDAPIIRYAELNAQGIPIELHRTVFMHEVKENCVIVPEEADGSWTFVDGEWKPSIIHVESVVVEPEPQTMIESSHVEAEGEQN